MTRLAVPRVFALVLIAVLFAGRPGFAQEIDDRVRVVTTAGETVIGHVAQTSEDGLTLVLEDEASRDFTYVEIERLERNLGVSYAGWGGTVGFFTGGGVALLTGAYEEYQPLCLFGCPKAKNLTAMGWIIVGAGAVGGAYLGYRIGSNRWKTVPLVDVQDSSLLLGMRVRF